MSTLARFLRPLLPHIPPELIAPDALEGILRVADLLPSEVAFSTFGFECALTDPRPRADFLVSFQSAAGGADLLARLPWATAQSLGRCWGDPSHPLHTGLEDLWLEFDTSEGSEAPSLFFAPVGADAAEVTGAAVRSLTGADLPPAQRTLLRTCLDRLPPRARLFQVGVMTARPTRSLRLCIHEISADAIPRYLADLGSADTGPVLELVRQVFRRVNTIALDLDIADTLQPKIGLECYLDWTEPAEQPARWALLLADLADLGACVPAKQGALLAYPGQSSRHGAGALWPEELRRSEVLLAGARQSVLTRSLHHIKLVLAPGAPLAAKAYLAARYRWQP